MYPRANPWIASHDDLVKPFERTLHHVTRGNTPATSVVCPSRG